MLMAGLFLCVSVCGGLPTAEELKVLKPLPATPEVYTWPVPKNYTDGTSDKDVIVEVARIVGSITIMAETSESEIREILKIGLLAESRSGGPISLAILFRPWFVKVKPNQSEAYSEFGKAVEYWNKIQRLMQEVGFNPKKIVCLVDTETFDARTEPDRSAVAGLYALYNKVLKAIVPNCAGVEWYGFGWVPSSSSTGWSIPGWAVPFQGQDSVGFDSYYLYEMYLRRMIIAKNREHFQGVPLTVWMNAPGYGRMFKWKGNVFSVDGFDLPEPPVEYLEQDARETFIPWFLARPERFRHPVNRVIMYTHPCDSRIQNSFFAAWVRAAND